MARNPSVHQHAINRLEERFGISKEWLMNELDSGKFIWLKGNGNGRAMTKDRSAHLFYLPQKNEYCIVIMDDRERLAITVLTEEMAKKSTWAKSINDVVKLKAKNIALGIDSNYDSKFLSLYALERGGLKVTVNAHSYDSNFNPIRITITNIIIDADQIDTDSNTCTLTQPQFQEVESLTLSKIHEKKILPYCDFYITTGGGKSAALANKFSSISSLIEAENARRWFDG